MLDNRTATLTLMLLVASPMSAQEIIIVKEGETLSEIAKRELGDGNRWRYICDLNKNVLADCNILPIGTRLVTAEQPALQETAVPAAANVNESDLRPAHDRKNLLSNSTDFASDYWGGYFLKPELSSGQLDPIGGTLATRLISADSENSSGVGMSGILRKEALAVGEYTVGVWVRSTGASFAVTFGLSDRYVNRNPILVTGEWQYLQQHFVVTEPTDRIFQIYERTIDNPDWEIFGASVETGMADTPFYAAASQ